MPSIRYASTVLLTGLIILLGCNMTGAEEKPAAKVNGEVITESQLVQELMLRHGYAVLETMIETLAIRQKAKERDISATAEQVEVRYQEIRSNIVSSAPPSSQLTDSQAFSLWLAKNNINRHSLREELELQLLLEAMVKDDVTVTDQEVAQYYESHRKQLERPEAVQVSHITVTTKEEAEKIRQQIVDGETTFENAAKEHSIDPYGRDNGGLLPPLGRGELTNKAWEPVREQAFKLKTDGEISPVFQTPMGWDILRRETYQKGGTPPFEEIQEALTKQLYQARLAQAAGEMRTAIVKTSKIERIIKFPSASQPVAEAAASSPAS